MLFCYSHQRSSEANVSEILLTGLGPSHSLPHLLAMMDNDLVVYTAFPYHLQPAPGHLHLRFRKVCMAGSGDFSTAKPPNTVHSMIRSLHFSGATQGTDCRQERCEDSETAESAGGEGGGAGGCGGESCQICGSAPTV